MLAERHPPIRLDRVDRTVGDAAAVSLAKKDGMPYVEADAKDAISGAYPLARVLYVYVNKKPNQPLSPLEREFFKMVLSKQGQTVVVKDGFVPLPAKMAEQALAEILK
jgi:phosphate transport system substrate-binding protein